MIAYHCGTPFETCPPPMPVRYPIPDHPRLTWDRDVSDLSPVVAGTWVSVDHVRDLIVDGWSWSDILRTHPEIDEDDIRAILAYPYAYP